MVRRPLAHDRLGRLSAGLPRHDRSSARSRTSTSPTGSISPSSSPSRCCTSSTTRRSRSRCSARSPTSSGRGVQDAMVQWWYGHNAVGFFLTAGFLGMMYYFIPKRAERPVYSLPAVDRPLLGADLPLHLGRPAPPALHRAARLGADARHGVLDHAVDAVLGRHDQRPDDAVGRLGQAAHRSRPAHAWWCRVAFYGMSTFEGPMMSIKAVNSLSHYTDWTIGHVHSGALGWVGYHLVRRASTAWCRGCGIASGLYSLQARQLALLDRDHRHRALHLGDVGGRHHAGPDVARLHHRTASSNTPSSRPSRRCIPST